MHALAHYIDHTLLSPTATERDIATLVKDALRFHTFAVCVNSGYVPLASRLVADKALIVASTVGFPLGQAATTVKVAETVYALEAGADEIDVVWNLGEFLSGDSAKAQRDLAAVVDHAAGHLVKVILETGLLTPDQIRQGAQLAVDAGAGMVKTSTGFGAPGASIEAVKILRATVGPDVGVKASGGIRTHEDAIAMIEAGASRLGVSRTEDILSET